MGCGGVKPKENVPKEKSDIIKQLHGINEKKAKGLQINFLTSVGKTVALSAYNQAFKEELLEHGDESGSVKPWVANIVPPEIEVVEKKAPPQYELKIEHIFGYNNYATRNNLFFTDKRNICYISGACGIVQDINTLSQKIFGGLKVDSNKDCHKDDITSIAFHKGVVSMVATGQREVKPSILVWSPKDPSVVFYKFFQEKGSKEVSLLQFDPQGEYLVSIGLDFYHSFYVYKFETNSVYWTAPVSPFDPLDLKFNPLGDEFCVVGEKLLMFFYLSRQVKRDALFNNKKFAEEFFTSAAYTKEGICLTSTTSGKIILWENCAVLKNIDFVNEMIHFIFYSPINDRIYIADDNNQMHVVKLKKKLLLVYLDTKEIFRMNSCVKALDINEEGDMIMGLKNGTIVLKDNKGMQELIYSYNLGKVEGIQFIFDRYLITSGEDNRIILYNVNTKNCEAIAPLYIEDTEDDENDETKPGTKTSSKNTNKTPREGEQIVNHKKTFTNSEKSMCISYNRKTEHIAVGLYSGYITIRKNTRKLSEKVQPDKIISSSKIIELKYSPSGKFLAVCCEDKEFVVLKTETYDVLHKLKGHEDHIIQFDWDVTSKFIQAVTMDNNYYFYDMIAGTLVTDPMEMRNINWETLSCKFGYYVQGIFMGSTDPDYVNSVACSNSHNLLVSGDDESLVNIHNFPCISDNAGCKSY